MCCKEEVPSYPPGYFANQCGGWADFASRVEGKREGISTFILNFKDRGLITATAKPCSHSPGDQYKRDRISDGLLMEETLWGTSWESFILLHWEEDMGIRLTEIQPGARFLYMADSSPVHYLFRSGFKLECLLPYCDNSTKPVSLRAEGRKMGRGFTSPV